METSALRYLILRDIDKVAYNVKHATLVEHIVRVVREITIVERKCWDGTWLEQLRESLFENSVLQICIPPSKTIDKYLHRVNATLLACSTTDRVQVFVDALSEVFASRVLGAVIPIMTTELRPRKELVRYYTWMLMTKLVHPQASAPLLVPRKIPSEHLESILKHIPRDGSLTEGLLNFLQEYVLLSIVSKHSLQLRLKQFMLDTLCDEIGIYLGESFACGAPFQFHHLIDTMQTLAAQPYSYRVWQPLVDALVLVTEKVYKKIMLQPRETPEGAQKQNV